MPEIAAWYRVGVPAAVLRYTSKVAGPAPADQLSATWPSPGTARSPNGADGTAEPVRISMALTIGVLKTDVNATAIRPDASAVTLNCSTSALN